MKPLRSIGFPGLALRQAGVAHAHPQLMRCLENLPCGAHHTAGQRRTSFQMIPESLWLRVDPRNRRFYTQAVGESHLPRHVDNKTWRGQHTADTREDMGDSL